jgi:glutathione synthase/RimK-type ligase-like ATP-grasp enzyme
VSPLVAWVTAGDELVAVEDVDRDPVFAALEARGLRVEAAVWDDPAVDWARYDLALLRAPWDYTEHTPEFLAWLDRVDDLTQVLNPPRLVRWNLDKRYMADLDRAGVAVVPTAFATSHDEARAAVHALAVGHAPGVVGVPLGGIDEVVVKPTVSAGSRNTGRFAIGDGAALDLADVILDGGGEVMVQACIPSVAVDGERAVVLVDGVVSHVFRKGPILALGGGFVDGTYTEDVTRADATDAEVATALEVAAALVEIGRARGWPDAWLPLLYGRIDLVGLPDGATALLEAELFEPALFVHVAPGAADRFAAAVAARLNG